MLVHAEIGSMQSTREAGRFMNPSDFATIASVVFNRKLLEGHTDACIHWHRDGIAIKGFANNFAKIHGKLGELMSLYHPTYFYLHFRSK